MAVINGEKDNAYDGISVLEYLSKHGREPSQVAVMINGDILPKDKYADTVIEENSEVEIIGFVGGG